MRKTVYFARHGETELNKIEAIQGPDSQLSELGLRQADILARRAADLDFDQIIASDWDRAKVTAERIAEVTRKPLELSELFQEVRKPSAFWGKTIPDNPDVLAGRQAMDDNFHIEDWHHSDEENFYDAKRRGQRALKFLEEYEKQNLLVVSHGNFLRVLLGVMLKGDRYSSEDYLDIESVFKLQNTSITLAEYEPHWRLEHYVWRLDAWNDHAHLGELTE